MSTTHFFSLHKLKKKKRIFFNNYINPVINNINAISSSFKKDIETYNLK